MVLAAIITTGTAFADYPGGLGIGIQGGGAYGWAGGLDYGAALSLKIPSLPIFWTIQANFGGGEFGLNVAGDVYLIHNPLVDSANLDWYLGLGIGAGIWGFSDTLGLGASGRVPVGLSWQPIDLLELYLQIVPQLGVSILRKFRFPYGGMGANLGLRLWF